ncbi:MAG: MerC family mercury resistance protein [Candidatus Rokubacteria bacterium]|nr:MerC family mercury resistance protein [Candidatus Rokubacteria bacterium]
MPKLGVLGSMVSAVLNLGCCAGLLGPLAPMLVAGGLLDGVPVAWRLPLLYGSLAVALVGFGLGWRRHRRLGPLLLFLPGAAAIGYPFHEALEVWVLQILIWLGFGLLLAAAAWDTWLAFRSRGRRATPSGVQGASTNVCP